PKKTQHNRNPKQWQQTGAATAAPLRASVVAPTPRTLHTFSSSWLLQQITATETTTNKREIEK
ncbi:hypothetical protein, partial [Salmonella sp. gx-h1]|uniref:hypothetical protein n=1 Tax=Salmonella sp. gx-h1 TaxID=2582609 RepID=UPI001F1AB81A